MPEVFLNTRLRSGEVCHSYPFLCGRDTDVKTQLSNSRALICNIASTLGRTNTAVQFISLSIQSDRLRSVSIAPFAHLPIPLPTLVQFGSKLTFPQFLRQALHTRVTFFNDVRALCRYNAFLNWDTLWLFMIMSLEEEDVPPQMLALISN